MVDKRYPLEKKGENRDLEKFYELGRESSGEIGGTLWECNKCEIREITDLPLLVKLIMS